REGAPAPSLDNRSAPASSVEDALAAEVPEALLDGVGVVGVARHHADDHAAVAQRILVGLRVRLGDAGADQRPQHAPGPCPGPAPPPARPAAIGPATIRPRPGIAMLVPMAATAATVAPTAVPITPPTLIPSATALEAVWWGASVEVVPSGAVLSDISTLIEL